MPIRPPPSLVSRSLLIRCMQKEERAVRDARQTGTETPGKTFEGMLVIDFGFDLFPVDAEGGIGEHVVELVGVELIVTEGVAELDAADILPLDQHIRFANGIGFGVQFLAEGAHHRLGIEFVDVFHAAGEKAARPRRRVVDGADDAVPGQRLVVFHKDQRGGETDDIARGEVLPGGFIGTFSKAPDQLLEDQTHLVVGDCLGAEIGVGKLLHHLVKQVGVVQLTDELGELEILEDLPRILGEALDVVLQIVLDPRLAQLGKIHRRDVEKTLVRRPQHHLFVGFFRQIHRADFGMLGQHSGLALLQHAFKTTQQGKGKDDTAILALLEITAQQIGNRPDKGGGLGEVDGHKNILSSLVAVQTCV